LQSATLDGPVRGNGKIIQELKRNLVALVGMSSKLCGREWDRDDGVYREGALVSLMNHARWRLPDI
jgi:pyruvate dehydrogenase complex dehydrogenase (E1) component